MVPQTAGPGFSAASALLLATAMGLFLGVVLGYPQWHVLRRAVHGAWIWVPANSAAWGVGMPAIFAAIDFAQQSSSVGAALGTIVLGLLATGALVGAVHGLVLVWLAAHAPMQMGAA